MAVGSVENQASAWDDALWTGKEPLVSDLAKLVFGLSFSEDKLDKLGNYKYKEGLDINTKIATYLTPKTSFFLHNGLKSL